MKSSEICKRIRIIKTILGLTQNEFAEKLNVTQQAISRYLTNRVPKWDLLIKIIELAHTAGETSITIDWIILGGEKRLNKLIVSEPSADYITISKNRIDNKKLEILLEKLNNLNTHQIDLVIDLINQLNTK